MSKEYKREPITFKSAFTVKIPGLKNVKAVVERILSNQDKASNKIRFVLEEDNGLTQVQREALKEALELLEQKKRRKLVLEDKIEEIGKMGLEEARDYIAKVWRSSATKEQKEALDSACRSRISQLSKRNDATVVSSEFD